MSSATTDGVPRANPPGLFGHFSALLAAKLAYWKARLELAGLEGKEAVLHFGIILALVVAGLVLVLFGYLFVVLTLVFLVALAFDGEHSWMWVLGATALLHFIGAGVLIFIAKNRLGAPLFPLTLDELKKDQEWLKTNAKPN